MIEDAIGAGLVAIGGLTGALVAATVEISGATLIPAGAVVGLTFVVWRASGEWRALNDKVQDQGKTLTDLVELMRSRPCVLPKKGGDECPIENSKT